MIAEDCAGRLAVGLMLCIKEIPCLMLGLAAGACQGAAEAARGCHETVTVTDEAHCKLSCRLSMQCRSAVQTFKDGAILSCGIQGVSQPERLSSIVGIVCEPPFHQNLVDKGVFSLYVSGDAAVMFYDLPQRQRNGV